MDIFHALILGIVEGITEFLPISSTGHLLIASELFGIAQNNFVKSFEIIIQLGAILSIIAIYPKRLLAERTTMLRVAAGFLPTAILGLLFYKIIKLYLLDNILVVLAALFFGGIFIIIFEKHWKPTQSKNIDELTLKEAALIGTLQSVAFIPGISRSGATIFSGLCLGLSREAAVEFSFLLAVPTMAAATGLDILKNYKLIFATGNFSLLAVGFIASFTTAFVAIKWLLRYVATHDFIAFGVYRIILALAFFFVFF